MKTALLFFSTTLICASLFAQNYCSLAPRFNNDTTVFPNITVTSNVIYGKNWDGVTTTKMDTLKLDIYQPAGDTLSARPLIVIAHGGSFLNGKKTDADQVLLGKRFAKCGYVVAAIDYRLGFTFPPNSHAGKMAVNRAGMDMKAALRFFFKDAHTANLYKIDTNNVFCGGVSAGAITAVNMVYCDKFSELPADIDTTGSNGMEGTSGNPGYSSRVKAVINVCGSIGDTSWIEPGNVPLVSLQGSKDEVVPYCKAMIYLYPPSTFPMSVVCGSNPMHARALNIGLENPYYSFYGGGHTSPASTVGHADTTVTLISKFLYEQLGCTPTNMAAYTNAPDFCAPYVDAVNEITLSAENVSVFPNPAHSDVLLKMNNVKGNKFTAVLTDVLGREAGKYSFSEKDLTLKRNGMQSGVYFLKMTSDANESFVAKIIFE